MGERCGINIAREQTPLSEFLVTFPQTEGASGGEYYAYGRDIFKRDRERGGAWYILSVIQGPPIFEYTPDPKGGYQISVSNDYIGSHWEPTPQETTEDLNAGKAVSLENLLPTKVALEWNWDPTTNPFLAEQKIVSEATTPDGYRVQLRELHVNKVIWSVALLRKDGNLSTELPLYRWVGLYDIKTIEEAQKAVEDHYQCHILEFQDKIHDADSGTFFGLDRSWETNTPGLLVQKMIYSVKHLQPEPLDSTEMNQLLDLNILRNQDGLFSEDRYGNLFLDHIYAELIVRYLAFGSLEEYSGDPRGDFSVIRQQMLEAGRTMSKKENSGFS